MFGRFIVLAAALCTSIAASLPAAALDLVDITGRTVTLDKPAQRILLGEGRFLVALSLLESEDPLSRVAGMMNEFRTFDPVSFSRYEQAFPGIADMPLFGQTSPDSVSLEAAIGLRPDAAVLGLSGHGPQQASETFVRALEAAGIPVVFIDFRNDPLGHTAESMRILGKVLGLEAEAEAVAELYEAEVAKVTDVMQSFDGKRPSVLLEVRVGMGEGCCFTIARGMLAGMIEVAGGSNIASGQLPGVAGVLNREFVIAADPDIYVGTAIGTSEGRMSGAGRIVLGPGVAEAVARDSLRAAVDRPALAPLSAVRDRRVFGIWHHFYNSPLNVVALQAFATWFQPALFADLEPRRTLEAFLGRMGPVDLMGTYATGLKEAGSGAATPGTPGN